MSNPTTGLSCFAVLLTLMACGGDREPSTRRGDTPLGMHGSDIPVNLTATIRGDADGGLVQVKGAVRLEDGTIVIADGFSGREQFLKAFDTTGTMIWSAGGQGAGPGEFIALSWLGRCGPDRLLTYDAAQSRFSVFDTRGKHTGESQLSERPLPTNLTCSSDGRVALMTYPAPSSPVADEFPRLTSTLVIAEPGGQAAWSRPNVYLGQNRILGTITRLAINQDYLYLGTGDSAFVDQYDRRGNRLRTFRVADEPGPPTRAQYEAAIDQLLNTMPGTPEARQTTRDQFLKAPMPERLPPYFGLHLSPAGVLWVLTSGPGDGRTELRGYDSTGASAGTITLPREVEVYEVGDTYLLTASRDTEGSPVVELFSLDRN